MNKIPPHMEQALDGSEPGVGHLLRVARERRREDLEDVAENLCIRWVHLNAIESGSYEDLPGKTYAVGFVRSYAEYLGLDADEVVRRFRAESAALRASSDLHFPSPVSETGFPGGRVLGLGLLLVALGYGGWYMTSQKDSALGELIAPIPERLAGLLPEGLRPAPSEAPDVQPGTPAARAPAPEPRPVTPAPPAPLVTHLTSSPSSDPAPAAAPQPETPVAASAPPMVEKAVVEKAVVEKAVVEKAVDAAVEHLTVATPANAAPVAIPANAAPVAIPANAAPVAAAPVTAIVAEAKAAEAPAPAVPAPADSSAFETGDEDTPPAPPTMVQADDAAIGPASGPGTETPAPQTVAALSAPAPVVTVPAPPLVEAPAAAPPAPPTLSSPSLAVRAPVAPPAPADSLIDMSAAPAVGSSGDGILVRATKDSWIQVRDVAADALLVTQLLRAGDSYAVPDRSGLVLLTGNAGALEILVNGESMPPIGGEGDVRRGVALNADRLRAGTAVIE